jgi:hypothetical protein
VKFEFNEEAHEYRLDDERIPSVTEILEPLQELDGIPRAALDIARERGWAVHKACSLLLHRQLDWPKLDPKIVNYVQAAQKFLKETEVTPLRIEYPMVDPELKFAGTLDLLGVMHRFSCIFDWKAVDTMPRTAGPQTAAYDYLHRRTLGGRPLKRYGVHLKEDGTYRLYEYADKRDWSWFASALNLWHWKRAA